MRGNAVVRSNGRILLGACALVLGAYAVGATGCVGDDAQSSGSDGGGDTSNASDTSVPDGASGDSGSNDGGGTDGGPTAYGRFAYVANNADGTITAYTADGPTGWLRIGGYALAGKGGRLAVDGAGKHLYAASGTDSNVTVFPIGADGSLPFNGTTTTLGGAPVSIALEAAGRFAYVAAPNSIFQFAIDANTGALSPLQPAYVATGVASLAHALAVDPGGKSVYLAANDGLVYQYTVGGNGALTAMAAPSIAGGPGSQAMAIDPTGKHAYVTASTDNAVYQYTIGANGMLAAMTPAKIATGGGPVAVTVDPSGRFAYVANRNDSTLSQFSIDAQTGALSALSPATAATGTNPNGVTVDPSGRFVYTENQADDTVTQLTIGGNGALTADRAVRTRDAPVAFAITKGAAPIAYKSSFAYTTSYFQTDAGVNVSQYTINATGGLVGAGTAPGTASAARYVTANSSGTYVYVSNLLGQSIAQYSVGTTGALTPLTPTFVATDTGPIGHAIDPNGRFSYEVNYYSNTVRAFSLAAGKLAANGAAVATGSNPVCAALDPTGRFLYASNTDSSATGNPAANTSISSYTLDNVVTGALTASTTYPHTNDKTWCVSVDPTGRYAYLTTFDAAGGTVYQYKIGTNGALVALSPASVSTGAGSGLMAFDPFGRFAYVGNGSANKVSQYAIVDGALQPLSPAQVSTGQAPSAVTVDFGGQHAYVTNATDNTISQFSIGANGALSQMTPATVGLLAGTFPTSITTTGGVQ